jgi:3D (Asp-Asp-Asp) domain-containing protein
MKIKPAKFAFILGIIIIASMAVTGSFLPVLYSAYGEPNNNCSDGWHITGYFNPYESDYSGSKRTISVAGAPHDETTFIGSFLDSVLVEGAGLTHYGWWIANYDGEWQRIPFPEDAQGGQLEVGSVATDPAVIPLGTNGITIPTLPSPWKTQVFKSVDTGGGPDGNDVAGKHIDVFTGDGKAAEQETFRITGTNNTVCISNTPPTQPPSPSPGPTPPPPADRPPVADAGHFRPDQIINEGSLVTLDGSASRDPNGDPLTYLWTQIAGPAIHLTNPNEAKTSFTAPSNLVNDLQLGFKLTVTDTGGLYDSDAVSILVKHTATPTPPPPPAPPAETTFDFGAAGDFGDGSTATDTAQLMVNHHIDLFVGEGDYCYCSNDGRWWTDTMRPLSTSGIIAKGSEGNHEVEDGHGGNDLRQMWGESSWQTSFDYKNTHFVILPEDSAMPDPKWLENDLSSARANAQTRWIIVVFHEPIYTSKSDHPPDENGIKDTVLPLIDKYHVDLVLQGHNHNYQRTFPMAGDQVADRAPNSNYLSPKGTMYMVIGTGGQDSYSLGNQAGYVQEQFTNDHGFVDFHVTDNQIIGTYYSDNGDTVRDTFTISK